MRRRKLLVALAGLAVVVAAGVVALWPGPEPYSHLTRERFQLITPGMTLLEVTAILGPPCDHTPAGIEWVMVADGKKIAEFGKIGHDLKSVEIWRSDTAEVRILLDQSDRTMHGIFIPREAVKDSTMRRAQRVVRQVWHRWFPE